MSIALSTTKFQIPNSKSQITNKNRLKRFLALTGLIVLLSVYAHDSNAATISKPMHNFGLVGYWSFDVGKGGSTARDMSGQGNHGTLTNMDTATAWVDGKIGQALSFERGGTVNAGSGSSLNVTGNTLSISAWVKKKTANQTLVSLVERGTVAANGYTLGLGVSPCTTNQLKVTKYAVADLCVGSFPTNTDWHHLVIVWNSSGQFAYGQIKRIFKWQP